MKRLVPVLFVLLLLPCTIAFSQEARVHHVVLFNLVDDAGPEDIQAMIDQGEELVSGIPGVLEVSLGTLARDDRPVHITDYDLAMHVLWESNQAGDGYGPHERHQEFMSRFGHLVESIQVIDFYGNEQ